jgi:hypothetical protein
MGVISTQGIQFQLVANGEILDLFEDEDIKLSDNITGLFDLGVIPADFTRQITLPGTKKNNAFFEHVYDISVFNPDTFATNIKVPAYLDFGGLYLSQGYLQLNKVNLYANKFIDSYEVTLFGAVSSFAREVNRSFLNDLTSLSAYNHTSSYSNISASWAGNLFGGAIVYPLAEYGQRLEFTKGNLNQFGVDDIDGALAVQNFKPAIKSKIVLDAIFNEVGYTYSSSFINNGGLDDIYLVCNRALRYPVYSDVNLETYGVVKIGAITGSGMTDVVLPANTFVTLPWYNKLEDPQNFYNNGAYKVEVSSSLRGVLNLNINVSCSVNNMPGTFSANGTWQLRLIETGSGTQYSLRAIQSYIQFFDELQQSRSGGINTTYQLQSEFITDKLPVGNYYFQIKQRPNVATGVLPTVTMDPLGTAKSFLQVTKVNQAADNRIMNIPLNMPFGTQGIKQIDFITSIQKKFNLVIYPSKTVLNQFIIEPFNEWYNKGNKLDFNKYANLNERIEVIPANNLAVNELNFGDTLDQDYISQQFSKAANREFGKSYYTDLQNFFSQGKFEVKTNVASTQLLQIAGTGVSGSIQGLNPTQQVFYAGEYGMAITSSPRGLCSGNFDYVDVYSTTGGIDIGVVLYANAAGTILFTGYRAVFDVGSCEWYSIDPSTATVTAYVGNCTDFSLSCPPA